MSCLAMGNLEGGLGPSPWASCGTGSLELDGIETKLWGEFNEFESTNGSEACHL